MPMEGFDSLYPLQSGRRHLQSCCPDSLISLKREGATEVNVEFDIGNLLQFVVQDCRRRNRICDSAEIFEDRDEQRTRVIFEYFKLSYLGE